ncbi:hypothetical protein GH714_013349 [Hevea brasiliensis]|uniref:Uncharacterized protein n=1 Tax=Hevea brasiliensis TaxID=3981 RepID=A0A6A6LG73_HEVBR|nr:hypothetical protein GH714_013349 [Hevea brasiliensis]
MENVGAEEVVVAEGDKRFWLMVKLGSGEMEEWVCGENGSYFRELQLQSLASGILESNLSLAHHIQLKANHFIFGTLDGTRSVKIDTHFVYEKTFGGSLDAYGYVANTLIKSVAKAISVHTEESWKNVEEVSPQQVQQGPKVMGQDVTSRPPWQNPKELEVQSSRSVQEAGDSRYPRSRLMRDTYHLR